MRYWIGALLIFLVACTSLPQPTAPEQPPAQAVSEEANPPQAPPVATPQQTTTQTEDITAQSPSESTGTYIVGIKDEAVDIKDIKRISLTISTIHLVTIDNSIIDVPITNQDFDLIQLRSNGQTALAANTQVPSGDYTELRIFLQSVGISQGGSDKQAAMPRKVLNLKGDFSIYPGRNHAAIIDFKADQSIFVTQQGRTIFAPVVSYEEHKEAGVAVENNQVLLGATDLRFRKTLGMSANGDMELNYRIDPDAPLSWENNQLLIKDIDVGTRLNTQYTAQVSAQRLNNSVGHSASYEQCLEGCQASCMGTMCKKCEESCY